jgi:hypothetical protein
MDASLESIAITDFLELNQRARGENHRDRETQK